MAKLIIIGEAYGQQEAERGLPFVGPSGWMLDGLLSQAGLDRASIPVTNVFNLLPPRGDVKNLMTREKTQAATGFPAYERGLYVPASLSSHLSDLRKFVEAESPNLILALGNTALWALCGVTGITKWRGSCLLSSFGSYKVLPTIHPAAILRQFEFRPIAVMDFCKARKEQEFPELVRPSRHIHLSPSLSDLEEIWEKHILPAPFVACDIETAAGQITEIGFAWSATSAVVVPFRCRGSRYNYWESAAVECLAWDWVKRVCAEKKIVGQNFQYDIQYLLRVMGIPCPHYIGDTMILHHSLQPEMKKSLGFLGSIYTSEPSWKFMRHDNETLKKED